MPCAIQRLCNDDVNETRFGLVWRSPHPVDTKGWVVDPHRMPKHLVVALCDGNGASYPAADVNMALSAVRKYASRGTIVDLIAEGGADPVYPDIIRCIRPLPAATVHENAHNQGLGLRLNIMARIHRPFNLFRLDLFNEHHTTISVPSLWPIPVKAGIFWSHVGYLDLSMHAFPIEQLIELVTELKSNPLQEFSTPPLTVQHLTMLLNTDVSSIVLFCATLVADPEAFQLGVFSSGACR